MKKIILSLAVVFVMFSFTTANTGVEKMNVEQVVFTQNDPEQECRDDVEFVITTTYFFQNFTMQELADLEIDLLIACFEVSL